MCLMYPSLMVKYKSMKWNSVYKVYINVYTDNFSSKSQDNNSLTYKDSYSFWKLHYIWNK